MRHRPHKLLVSLATTSGLILVASLFLPTLVVAFLLPPTGLMVGVGSIWSASKALTVAVAILLLPIIFAPCVAANGKKWLFPLAVTVMAMLTLVLMTIQAVLSGGKLGFGLTIVGQAALVAIGLCTLLEAIVARRSAAPAEPAS